MVEDRGTVRLGACPACNAPGRAEFGRRGELELWRCSACGLVYSDPQPRGLVAEKYTQTYDLAAHFGEWEERKTVLYERRFDWLPAPAEGADRVCDVGCADGQFLGLAAQRGWRPFGIELNPPAAAAARARGIEVYEGWFEDAEDLPWGQFDLVTAWDCIEHTPEPAEFAGRLARLLRPGGVLALTTLNVRSLVARAFRMRWSMVVEDHYTYWDLPSLRGLVNAAGLEVVSQHSFGLGRDFVTWVDALASRRSSSGEASPEASVGEAAPAAARWDARGVTVKAENAVNRVLDRTSTGVGQSLLARRPG